MTDTLKDICAAKHQHIKQCKHILPLTTLMEQAQRQEPPRGFRASLEAKAKTHQLALIAEIKKASPSKGLIRKDFDPPALAQAYVEGGACCLSVLTDKPYFQGHDSYLAAVKKHVSLPVLRKDFILDSYQVFESRALGADCILLIMACLDDSEAKRMAQLALGMDMDVLVEVHDEHELDRALAIENVMIGINNRNLKTLQVSLDTFSRLSGKVPSDRFLVAESGLHTHDDMLMMQQAGAKAYLVGESLMRQADIVNATKTLLNL